MSAISQLKGKLPAVDAALGHWIWAAPVLLVVALLAFQNINTFAPSPDEFRTMTNVGWVDGPYSPIEVLESLARWSPQQSPLYYWLLNLWGAVVPQEIAFARLLSLYFGLLFVAVCYRLARDFVATAAAPMALAIIASNAFLNLYLPNARMYTLYMLAAALALWFYLRIMHRATPPSRRDYIGFFLSCLALATTIIASVFVFAAVGAYHILMARKGPPWRRVCLCAALALLIYSPWAYVQFSTGAPKYLSIEDSQTANAMEILSAEVSLLFNGSPLLLLTTLAGLAIAWRRRHISLPRYLALIVFYLVVVALVEQTVGTFRISRMRYLLPGALFLMLAQTAGIYALYRIRRVFCLLALLWIFTGLAYHVQRTGDDWQPEAHDRPIGAAQTPFHELGRYARRGDSQADIYAIGIRHQNLVAWRDGGYRLLDHYFDLDRVNFQTKKTLDGLGVNVAWNAVTSPSVWLWFQNAKIDEAALAALDAEMKTMRYTRCQDLDFALDARLREYWWSSLACRPPQPQVTAKTSLIHYQFYGARVIEGGATLAFSDLWRHKAGAYAGEYKMSYQVVNRDWENVAQLDLPLVHEDRPRQFTIDLSRLAAGRYRLVTLLYHHASGERLPWSESDAIVPEMLTLAEIEL